MNSCDDVINASNTYKKEMRTISADFYPIRLSHQQLTRVLVTSQTWDVTPASIGRNVPCRLLQRDTYTDCHAIRIACEISKVKFSMTTLYLVEEALCV